MKKILSACSQKLLILIFTIIAMSVVGQAIIEKDSVLKYVRSNLPTGWSMVINDTILTIEKSDTVWTMFANHINEAPRPIGYKEPTDNELKALFRKKGRKEKFGVSYRIEPKWSEKKHAKAKAYNDSINVIIISLWNKYGIESFYHRAKDGYSKLYDYDKFIPKTKGDSLNLKKYNGEKAQLEKRLITIPDKCSANYSLFSSGVSCHDQTYDNEVYSDIYPKSANKELWSVCQIMDKYCDYITKKAE